MSLKRLLPLLVVFSLLAGASAVRASGPLAAPDVPLATSDAYGYTVTSTTDANTTWIEAGSGTQLTFSAPVNGVSTAPVPLGFTFHFYEHSYTQVYVATNGLLVFGSTDPEATSYFSKIPRAQPPNNFLAPFWDVIMVSGGKVTYATGGGTGSHYAVIQYSNVSLIYEPSSDLTFQVILRENGNFEFLYQSLTLPGANYVVGIEDGDGIDGIQHLYQQAGLATNLALRFTRPAPSRRVKALSIEESTLLTRNKGSVNLTFRNTGDLGSDIIEFPSIPMASGWSYTLINSDTYSNLQDTDSNGMLDSGVIAQGADFNVTVSVRNASSSAPGTYTRFAVIARSKNNTLKTASTQVQFAVPPSFAYAYSDNDNTEAMALGLVSAFSRKETAFDLTYSGASIGLSQVANENQLVFWEGENKYFSYTILDRFGNQYSPIYNVNDNNPNTEEITPIFATAPNNRTGLVYLYRDEGGVTSVLFKILDANGAPITGFTTPKNLTASLSAYLHSYSYPTIAATPNNRFIISWTGSYEEGPYLGSNMWVAVYDASTGAQLKVPTRVTTATDGVLEYEEGILAAMNNSNVMLAYTAFATSGDVTTRTVEWVGLDSVGNVLSGTRKSVTGSESTASSEVYYKDAIELSPDGNLLLAWLNEEEEAIKAIVINPSLTSSSGITTLNTPNLRRAKDLSITKTQEGLGVVHWIDASNGQYLYYALLDASGAIETPPMTLLKMQKPGKLFYASSTAQGLAPLKAFFTINLPATYDTYNPSVMSADVEEEELWQP